MGCFESKQSQPKQASEPTQKMGVAQLKQNYQIDNNTYILGSGSFGKVFKSYNKHNKNHEVAIKVLNKAKLQNHLENIKEEVKILTKLDHPNIVKYYETYDDNKYMYLVMEYCDGGELFDKIASQKNQTFSEAEACVYMTKLFQAINHCHASNIVHRDIKPENIMIGKDKELKLIDFGLSKAKGEKGKLHTIAGTPFYMAPEVLDGGYSYKADIWSLGVLLYILLSGYLPFQGEGRNEVFAKILGGSYHFNHKEFLQVSDEGKDLIQKLLVVDQKRRINGTAALEHPWFKKFKRSEQKIDQIRKDADPQLLDSQVLQRLSSFKGVSKLKKAAMNILIKMLQPEEIEDLRKVFQQLDIDGTGYINAQELQTALQKGNSKLDQSEIQKIISEVDYFGNNKINYSEFLAATISTKQVLNDNMLLAIFNQFDTDNSGYITQDNIVNAMIKLGHQVDKKEVQSIMAEHDITGDNQISFNEFKQIFEIEERLHKH